MRRPRRPTLPSSRRQARPRRRSPASEGAWLLPPAFGQGTLRGIVIKFPIRPMHPNFEGRVLCFGSIKNCNTVIVIIIMLSKTDIYLFFYMAFINLRGITKLRSLPFYQMYGSLLKLPYIQTFVMYSWYLA